ncbi:serine/arginine repetitive matrix protein 3-like [Muntiacus reevesi]|uniref:serine/arginine repetitive matrix protein 3-like n=1 Tax=Muntiacus reevesi TaxID=9886 RepID=UPI0033076716
MIIPPFGQVPRPSPNTYTPRKPALERGISVLAADSLSRGNLRVKEALSRTGPEKGTNGKFPHTQAAPGPRLGRRLSHPGRLGHAGAGGNGALPGSPKHGPASRGSSAQAVRLAAVCRPPLGVPGARGLARSGRIGLRRRLQRPPPPSPPPPAAPLARSQSPPLPGARGAGGKRLPRRRGAGRAGPQRAWGCGAGGRARGRGACVSGALQRPPRPPRSRARPRPHPAASRGPRVNELDFGDVEAGALPRTFCARAHTHMQTHTQTHTHTHTHTPRPPNSGFRPGVGGEEVEAKTVQTMERGKTRSPPKVSQELRKEERKTTLDTEEPTKATAASGMMKQRQTQALEPWMKWLTSPQPHPSPELGFLCSQYQGHCKSSQDEL